MLVLFDLQSKSVLLCSSRGLTATGKLPTEGYSSRPEKWRDERIAHHLKTQSTGQWRQSKSRLPFITESADGRLRVLQIPPITLEFTLEFYPNFIISRKYLAWDETWWKKTQKWAGRLCLLVEMMTFIIWQRGSAALLLIASESCPYSKIPPDTIIQSVEMIPNDFILKSSRITWRSEPLLLLCFTVSLALLAFFFWKNGLYFYDGMVQRSAWEKVKVLFEDRSGLDPNRNRKSEHMDRKVGRTLASEAKGARSLLSGDVKGSMWMF